MGEGGVLEGVHAAAEDGGEAVGAEGVGDTAFGDGRLGCFTDGEDVAGGLHHGDQGDDTHGDNGGRLEL